MPDQAALVHLPDQVAQYRCIASHESALLEDFSLCILQRHNCLGKSAEIPALPDPPPMHAFRGIRSRMRLQSPSSLAG